MIGVILHLACSRPPLRGLPEEYRMSTTPDNPPTQPAGDSLAERQGREMLEKLLTVRDARRAVTR